MKEGTAAQLEIPEAVARAIGYNEYPESTPVEERLGAPMCVVSHPDAGGPCGEGAVMEVWALSFCRRHGEEAKLAALEEIGAAAEDEARFDGVQPVLTLVSERTLPRSGLGEYHRAAVAAYPPSELAANIDADTLLYDYGHVDGDPPYDWWSEASILMCRFMRQAYARGVLLTKDLELLRERAVVQQLLAHEDMERRCTAPRRAAREAGGA